MDPSKLAQLANDLEDLANLKSIDLEHTVREVFRVKQHFALNIPLDIFNAGQTFSDFNSNPRSTNMFKLLMLFLQLLDTAWLSISVPSAVPETQNYGIGSNAGGAAMEELDLDDMDQENNNNEMINLTNYDRETLLSHRNFYEIMSNALQKLSIVENEDEKNKKKKQKKPEKRKRSKTKNKPSSIPSKIRNVQNNIFGTRNIQLPPMEVFLEPVVSCPDLKSKYRFIEEAIKEKKQKDIHRSQAMQTEKSELAGMGTSVHMVHNKNVSGLHASASKFDIQLEDDETTIPSIYQDIEYVENDTIERAYQLSKLISDEEAMIFSTDNRFKGLIKICDLLHDTKYTDFTLHVIFRAGANIDFNALLKRELTYNFQTYLAGKRVTSRLHTSQLEYIDNSQKCSGEEVSLVDNDQENQEKKKRKSFRLPRPDESKLPRYNMHRLINTTLSFALIVDAYRRTNEFDYHNRSRYMCDESFDFGPDHPLNARNVFNMGNALESRSEECSGKQSKFFVQELPETYIVPEHTFEDTFTLRFPVGVYRIDLKDVNPASFCEKFLPHVQASKTSVLQVMHPTLRSGYDKARALEMHYDPVTYPYDTTKVHPPRINEQFLTIQEIDIAVTWLQSCGMDPKLPERSIHFDKGSYEKSKTIASMTTFDDPSYVPIFIQLANPMLLYKEVRKHLVDLVKLHYTESTKLRNKLMQSHSREMDDELFEQIVQHKMRSNCRMASEQNLKYAGTAFRLEDRPEMLQQNSTGYVMNQLRDIYTGFKDTAEKVKASLKKTNTFDPTVNRVINWITQLSGVRMFDELARGEKSDLPDACSVIVEYDRVNKLYLPEHRCTIPIFDLKHSMLTNITGNFLLAYIKFFHVYRCGLLFFLLICTLDATRDVFDGHMHVNLSGDGARGKTFTIQTLIYSMRIVIGNTNKVMIRKTSWEVDSNTSQAEKVNSLGRLNGGVLVNEELSLKQLYDEKEGGSGNPTYKKVRDSGVITTKEATVDHETGQTVERLRTMELKGVCLDVMNGSMDGCEESIKQRSLNISVADHANDHISVNDRQTGQELSKGTYDEKVVKKRYEETHKILQALVFYGHYLETQGTIQTSSTLSMYLILATCGSLEKECNVILNPRANKFLTWGASILMYMDIFMSEFFCPGGRYYNQSYSRQAIMSLEPELYTTTHHAVASIGIFWHGCITAGMKETRLALKDLMKEECDKLFSPIHMFAIRTVNAGEHGIIPDGNSGQDHQNKGLNYESINKQTLRDMCYIQFSTSNLDAFCEQVHSNMKGYTAKHKNDGEEPITQIFASRTIRNILVMLSKMTVETSFYTSDIKNPRAYPIEDTSKGKKNIPIVVIGDHFVRISYAFIISPFTDPYTAILRVLRKTFNARKQPIAQYMCGMNTDSSYYCNTIALGEGLTEDDFTQVIPTTKHKSPPLRFRNVGYISRDLMHAFYSPEEIKEYEAVKTARINEVNMPMDAWAAFMHAQKIGYTSDIITQRTIVSTLWNMGNNMAGIKTAVVDAVSAMNPSSDNDECRKEIGNVFDHLRTSMEGLPANMMKLAHSARKTEVSAEPEDAVSKRAMEIINTFDDEEDIDVPKSKFMVPWFENEPHCITEFYTKSTPPKVKKYVPHWEIYNGGMTLRQYKTVAFLPDCREDRIKRHYIVRGDGNKPYPAIAIAQYEAEKITDEQVRKEEKGEMTKRLQQVYNMDPSKPLKSKKKTMSLAMQLNSKTKKNKNIAKEKREMKSVPLTKEQKGVALARRMIAMADTSFMDDSQG